MSIATIPPRFTRPWHISADALPGILSRYNAPQSEGFDIEDFIIQRQPYVVTSEGIAVIDVRGPLGRGLTNIDRICGDTDYNDIIEEVLQATNDQNVKGILLTIDSPGGSVQGGIECRDAIANAAKEKPVVVYTEGLLCSAAYEIAAGASVIAASPSAIVGSIGTFCVRPDFSEAYAQMGVKIHVIAAKESDLKTAHNPSTPLEQDGREEIQRSVNRWNADFLQFVSAHRNGIAPESMRGQVFDAREAQELGLVDAIGDIDDALDEVLGLAE